MLITWKYQKKFTHQNLINIILKHRIKTDNGCCSVLLHVKDGYDIFSYRRDSTYQVKLYFTNIKWHNKQAIKEYKTVNGYSFHTIITHDGWIVSAGGSDIPQFNKELEDLAGKLQILVIYHLQL